jgi:peroxiredoxin
MILFAMPEQAGLQFLRRHGRSGDDVDQDAEGSRPGGASWAHSARPTKANPHNDGDYPHGLRVAGTETQTRGICMNRFWGIALGLLLIGAGIAHAAKPAPEEKTGLKVGEKAPDFKLKDQTGTQRSLAALLEDGNVALVFYRSAGWWPYCQRQLVQLQKNLKAIEDAGVNLVGISYDSVEVLKGFADKQQITFPLLSDPESQTIIAYSLKNKEMVGKKFGKINLDGIPYPGTLLVDREGIIRAKLFVDGYKERHSIEDLVKAAEKLKK